MLLLVFSVGFVSFVMSFCLFCLLSIFVLFLLCLFLCCCYLRCFFSFVQIISFSEYFTLPLPTVTGLVHTYKLKITHLPMNTAYMISISNTYKPLLFLVISYISFNNLAPLINPNAYDTFSSWQHIITSGDEPIIYCCKMVMLLFLWLL